MMNMNLKEVYDKAYEAGKQDVLAEVKAHKYVLYSDICGEMISLKDSHIISKEIYKLIMKRIDIIFLDD